MRCLFALSVSLITLVLSNAMTISVAIGQDKPSPHPRVLGFERFQYDAKADQVAGGMLLLGELNCTSCHAAEDSLAAYVSKKQAPVLDEIGSRSRGEYFLKFLANPQATKAGTTMPNVFAGLSEDDAKKKAELLAHFVASQGQFADATPSRQAAIRGENLFHTAGCVVCHGPRKEGAPPVAGIVPLGTPSKKYTLPGLTKFLKDPLHARPSGRMPNMNLNDQEAGDVAAFLLADLAGASGLDFTYVEGTFDKVPDFSKVTAKASGPAEKIDLSLIQRKDNFAIRFDGLIQVAKEGDYSFYLLSDDGSKLSIDGRLVVDNDGIHAPSEKSGKVKLTAGKHAITVEFFEQGGGEELRVEVEGPDLPRKSINDILAAPDRTPAPDAPKPFTVIPELASLGKDLFASSGCAACHQLKQGDQAIASTAKKAPALVAMKSEGGCLSEKPNAKTPFFALNDTQRKSIAAALNALKKPLPALTPSETIDRHLTRSNCVGCHNRGELGGVQDDANPYFTSAMKEIGDEGRLPPQLTIVGAKLKEEWLKKVLDEGAKVRPYMYTRMPKFGSANVGQLVNLLAEADKGKAPKVPEFQTPADLKKFKASGRFMVGAQGLSCIKCHTFNGKGTPGIQVMDLTTMTSRLREDWYYHYMLNPVAFRPGTRMPAAWPNGQTVLPKVLEGNTPKQIMAVWAFLTDGEKAQMPIGMVEAKIELLPIDEPLIYRNFIEGAGPRAIGVGFPQKLNYAWDANHNRLAMIWQGGFIDASMHWVGRGPGYQKPLGDAVIQLPKEAPLAVLDSNTTEWPATTDQNNKDPKFKFLGYTLDPKQNPTFRFKFDDLTVEDLTLPKVDGEVGTLTRTLSFASDKPASNVYYLVATGKVTADSDNWYKVGDSLRIHAPGAMVRESKGRQELLAPVKLEGGKAKIALEYEW